MSVGVAGEDAPRVCIRSRMAYPQGQDPLHEGTPKWVEDQEKNQKNGEILYEQVIDRGIPLDWLLLEQIWTQTFLNNDLGMAKPKEHLVLVTEPLRQPHATRIRVAEIMMKTFEFSGMYFCKQPVLALFGTGRTSGCVLESGHHLTYRKRDKPGSIFYETRITFFSFEIYQTRINFVLGCHAKFS